VISLVLPSTSAWPRTARLVWSITASRWTRAAPWWPLPRRVLPSTATAGQPTGLPVAAGWSVPVAAGRPATGRARHPRRQRRHGPAPDARWPHLVAARRLSRGHGAPPARPGQGMVRRRPTHRWLPRTSPRPAPRTPRRRAHRPVDGVGLAAAWGRAHQRDSRAGRGTGQAPSPGMDPDDWRWRRWAMMCGQARSPVVVMGFDNHMIAGNRACSTSTGQLTPSSPTRQPRTLPRPCARPTANSSSSRAIPYRSSPPDDWAHRVEY
jgi:hypothetical protein